MVDGRCRWSNRFVWKGFCFARFRLATSVDRRESYRDADDQRANSSSNGVGWQALDGYQSSK